MNERETFQADQAEAQSRDQEAWETNIASAHMDVAMKAAHASTQQAKTQFWSGLASLVNVVWVLVLLVGLTTLGHLITGWWF